MREKGAAELELMTAAAEVVMVMAADEVMAAAAEEVVAALLDEAEVAATGAAAAAEEEEAALEEVVAAAAAELAGAEELARYWLLAAARLTEALSGVPFCFAQMLPATRRVLICSAWVQVVWTQEVEAAVILAWLAELQVHAVSKGLQVVALWMALTMQMRPHWGRSAEVSGYWAETRAAAPRRTVAEVNFMVATSEVVRVEKCMCVCVKRLVEEGE